MGKPTFFDNIREWIGGVTFAIYLWSIRMTREQFWKWQEYDAIQHLFALLEEVGLEHNEMCAITRPHSHSADCDCGRDELQEKVLKILGGV